MTLIFDFQRLDALLRNFYIISGVRYTLVDPSYNVIFASGDHAEYCQMINSMPEGHVRCVQCDAQAAKQAQAGTGAHVYRCHAGAIEVVLPVVENGQVIAYLFFGQMLSKEKDLDDQWAWARKNLSWCGDADALREAFFRMQRLDSETIDAWASILEACSTYIWLQGVVKPITQTDGQRLRAYIDENYASHITLDEAAAALSMSKTKLCGLASKRGTTFTRMLNHKRIDEAKNLLLTTDLPISQVAVKVGMADYNYFTKRFRSQEGTTPREFRKTMRGKESRFSEGDEAEKPRLPHHNTHRKKSTT